MASASFPPESVRRAALWALLLPAHMAPRVSDIWRGYWAQRLVWEVGGVAAFFPPRVAQVGGVEGGMPRQGSHENPTSFSPAVYKQRIGCG